MNLENEVCDIEYAKKLKELGIKQESNYCYAKSATLVNGVWTENIITFTHREITNSPDSWSAFTASELIAELPNTVTTPQGEPFNNFRLRIRKQLITKDGNKFNNIYCINYECDTIDPNQEIPWYPLNLFARDIYDEKFANALALTKIYILEKILL